MCVKGGCKGCTRGCGSVPADITQITPTPPAPAPCPACQPGGGPAGHVGSGDHHVTVVQIGAVNGWALNAPTERRRAYVAGPMRGHAECNFPLFDAAAAHMRGFGWDIISPAEHDRGGGFNPCTPDCTDAYLAEAGFVLKGALRWDLGVLLDSNTTDIVLLDGWEKSWGATLECKVAQAVGLRLNRLTGNGTAAAPFHLYLDYTVPDGR
jgi:hypothetical protein